MSYYFAIVGTKDNPIFTHSFGTSKSGGDGIPRFREDARAMNQFVVHASLDLVEEAMWATSAMYLKCIDKFQDNYVSCFLTGTGMKFLLLHNPDPERAPTGVSMGGGGPGGPVPHAQQQGRPSSRAASMATALGRPGSASGGTGSSGSAGGIAANPTSPATEEAIRQFFADVYESWVKTTMSPFYQIDAEIKSPAFRNRVATAAKKYL